MLAYLLQGAAFGFGAVVQPGPLQAFLMSRSARHGWRRTLPAALSPLLSDGPIILVAVLVLSRFPASLARWIQAAGGAFILYLALAAFRAWRDFRPAEPAPRAAAGSLLQATAVNFLNPNPWISWSLVLGPLLLKGWREAPSHGIALLAGFYGVIVAGTAAIIVLFGLAGKLDRRVSRALIGLSAAILAAFGAYLLWSATR
jgi:threonine/homoserine/homoserine lactone efflux protein